MNNHPKLGREGMVIVLGLAALGGALMMLAICALVDWIF